MKARAGGPHPQKASRPWHPGQVGESMTQKLQVWCQLMSLWRTEWDGVHRTQQVLILKTRAVRTRDS